MILFDSSVDRLIPSNLACTEVDASQIMSFIEDILFSSKEKSTAHKKVA